MSEERLAAIESLLGTVVSRGDELAAGQQGLVTRMDEFAAGQQGLVTRMDEFAAGQQGLVSRMDEFAAGQQGLVTRMDEVAAGQTRLETRIDEVDRHMRVLHEDVLDRIAAIPTDGPTRVEVKRALEDQAEAIGRRLDPLEVAVMRHTAEIEQMKNARG